MYCTIDDILTRIDEKVLVNLTNDIRGSLSNPQPLSVNLQILNQMIDISDDMINSALRNKYSLPLKSTPKIITQISADITIYRLYSRRPQDVPKNYIKNFQEAIELLKEFQNGSKLLDIESNSATDSFPAPKMYLCDKDEKDRRFNGGFRL